TDLWWCILGRIDSTPTRPPLEGVGMRREEITDKLIQMMTAESEWVKTGIELEEVHNGIRRVAEGVAPHVVRLLADERAHGRQEANGDWLSCLIGRAGDTSYGELAGPILNVSDTLTRFIEAEREKYLEALCASVCSFCALPQKYDLHAPPNVGRGYWCHTEKGVSPTWENKRCVAMSFRNVNLDLTALSSTEEGDSSAK
ncbi:MAG: hypothetical protein J3T61_09630, partial [Candidatus Brocadiales bacterium]|nr:hypothetical protein [Candidatus Bathyanammoxibius sp.]